MKIKFLFASNGGLEMRKYSLKDMFYTKTNYKWRVVKIYNIISENNLEGKCVNVRQVVTCFFQGQKLFLLGYISVNLQPRNTLCMVHKIAPIIKFNCQQIFDIITAVCFMGCVAGFANVDTLIHTIKNSLLILVKTAHILVLFFRFFGLLSNWWFWLNTRLI